MTKRLAVVLGVLVFAAVMVAASAQAGHKTVKVTNVTFAGWSSGPDEDALDTQMANAFNNTVGAKEGIHVTWQVINGDYGQAMTPRFAAHNAPDVFYVDSSVIGTHLAFSADDIATGDLDGPNCRGPEKVARLQAVFGNGVRLDAAYGDTSGDTAMLALADEAGFKVFKGTP